MLSSFLQSVKDTAQDLGAKYVEHTGRAVDYGFLNAVEKTKAAIEYTGVADYATRALEVTNQAIISSARAREPPLSRRVVASDGKWRVQQAGRAVRVRRPSACAPLPRAKP